MGKTIKHRIDCDITKAFINWQDINSIPCTCDYSKRKKASDNRKAREEAYKSCGLVKVRGNLGGTYWE